VSPFLPRRIDGRTAQGKLESTATQLVHDANRFCEAERREGWIQVQDHADANDARCGGGS
jgi:hypothetical protein